MAAIRVSLKRRLKAFKEPDTRNRSVGYAEGTFNVFDKRRNYPTDDTDYVLIDHPELGEVWLCTRWMDISYADFEEKEPQPSTGACIVNAISETLGQLGHSFKAKQDSLTIKENSLVDLLSAFGDFQYNLKCATYPYSLKGVDLKVGPPYHNNSCSFVEAFLVKAWSGQCENFLWDEYKHGQMMILSDADYYSPVTAAIESGMANLLPNTSLYPAPWSILQVWRKRWSGAQTLIVVDCHKETGKVLTLESNHCFKLNGVGFREIGMLKGLDFRPPSKWWELPDVWTWDMFKQAYPHRKMAALKVKDCHWSGVTDLVT